MADKEVTVFVVDVSSVMGRMHEGAGLTYMDWIKQYVMYKLGPKIFAARSTDYIAMVCVGSEQTKHALQGDPEYDNIMVALNLPRREEGKPNTPGYKIGRGQVELIQAAMKPSSHMKGDLVSAIVVAMDMITKFCLKYKFRKNIIAITAGELDTDFDGVTEIAGHLKSEDILLTVMGIDFNDNEAGVKEADKPELKRRNEKGLKELTDLSDGVFATYAEVFESTKTPKVKQPRHVPTLKCQMILGSLDQYEESFSFSVERYARTKKATPPSSHKVSVVAGERDMKLQSQAGPGAAIPPSQGQVRQQRAYKTADGKEVEREQLERGYKYGSTIVGLSEADQDYLRFKSDASIMILGFLPKEDAFQEQPDGTIVTRKGYKRYLHMGQVNQIVAPSLDNRSGLAVSAMIHALQEFDAYALARLVSKDNTAPQMVLLAPYLESGFEALYQVNLPLAEDVRQYKFAPLDRVKNIKGEYAKAHRYLPTEDLVDAMDNLVDSMSLDALAVKTEDGQMEDVFRPEETYSVAVHRTMQLISHRFFNEQSTEMPPPAELLMRPSKVPQQIIESEAFKSAIERTIQVADVKKVPPKTAYKRRREDTGAEPKREVDIEALLNMEDEEDIAPGGDQSDNPEARALEIWTAMLGDGISARDPIRSFKTLVDRCPIQGNIEAPFLQLQTLLDDMIFHSMGDEEYESALQLVRVMREEAVKHEVDNIYNAFYDAVYGRLSDQGREDFAALLDQNSLGHITDAEIEAAAEAAETSNTGGSAGEGEATSDKDRSIKEEGPDSSARPNGDDDGDETTDGD